MTVALTCFGGFLAPGAIDLNPAVSEYTAEGFTFHKLLFKHDKQQIAFEPPRLWSYRFTGDALQLLPGNVERAEAAICATALASPQPLDARVIDATRQQFLHSLPAESQAVTVVAEEQNPALNNSPSYEITASYQALGEMFVRSTLFVNLPDTQLSFRLTARKVDFDTLYSAFRSSILSWHWINPQAAPGASAVATAASQSQTGSRD